MLKLQYTLLLGCCLALSSCGIPPTATIHVQDEMGRPIAGASVDPQPEIRLYGPIVSNERGNIVFGDVQVRYYHVGKDRYETQYIEFPGWLQRVTVTLKPQVDIPPPPPRSETYSRPRDVTPRMEGAPRVRDSRGVSAKLVA